MASYLNFQVFAVVHIALHGQSRSVFRNATSARTKLISNIWSHALSVELRIFFGVVNFKACDEWNWPTLLFWWPSNALSYIYIHKALSIQLSMDISDGFFYRMIIYENILKPSWFYVFPHLCCNIESTETAVVKVQLRMTAAQPMKEVFHCGSEGPGQPVQACRLNKSKKVRVCHCSW